VVWTLLYSDIAVTSAVALDRLEGDEAVAYRRALAANLVLNASWSFAASCAEDWRHHLDGG